MVMLIICNEIFSVNHSVLFALPVESQKVRLHPKKKLPKKKGTSYKKSSHYYNGCFLPLVAQNF